MCCLFWRYTLFLVELIMADCSTLVKHEKSCPENGSNMGPLKFWVNSPMMMTMMLEFQHFAEITAHASVSF